MTDVLPTDASEHLDDAGAPTSPASASWASWRWPVWLAMGCSAVVALSLAGSQIPGRGDFCLDDAWIHLSYAKSVRLGDGLSYNPGDLETGFSSPLWALMLAALPHASAPVLGVKIIGALLHALTAALTSALAGELARRRTPRRRGVAGGAAAVAGVLTAATPALVQGSTSGMEVPLAACLVSGVLLAMVRQRWGWAALVGALAVWARPEALFVVGAAAGLWSLSSRRPIFLAPLAGGAGALGAWVVYCLAVSGHPWPNTRYVKATEPGLSGLGYLAGDVLPGQPWLAGVGGLALLGLALWSERRGDAAPDDGLPYPLAVVSATWLATVVAIAVTRPLHPGTLFFESRYFAPVAHLPLVALAVGALGVQRRRWIPATLLVPVLAVNVLELARTRDDQRAQERSIQRLHTEPARWVRDHIRPETVIAVEGAGAQRYFTPRSMTVVDIIGLNDREIAHAPSSAAKLCVLMDRHPRLLVAPTHIVAPLAAAFEGSVVEEFVDPDYAQVRPRHPAAVQAVALGAPRPPWPARCASGGASPTGSR